MREQFAQEILSLISVNEIATMILAMTPIVGIRAALPVAILHYEMEPAWAYFWSVLGEFFPVIFILLFLKVVSEWLSEKFSFMKKFFDFLFSKTRRDYDGRVHKYGLFALFLYTGIPLPFSGAWTASLVTFLFGFPRRKALPVIFAGVLLSGVNILLIMELGIAIERYSGYMAVAGFFALAFLIYFLYHRRNKKNVQSSTIS